MTADQSSDQGRQRTVAELLEQYGETGRGGSRRRRRAEDEQPDDGAERINAADLLERGGSRGPDTGGPSTAGLGTAGLGTSGPGTGPGTAGPMSPPGGRDQRPGGLDQRSAGPGVPAQRFPSGYGQSIDPLTGEPIDPDTGPGRGARNATGSVAFVPPPAGPPNAAPPNAAPLSRSSRPVRSDPPTEQLPRYPEAGGDAGPMTGPMTGPVTGPLSWKNASTRTAADEDGAPTGQLRRSDPADDEDSPPLAGAAPAGLAERDDRGAFADRDLADRQRADDRAGERAGDRADERAGDRADDLPDDDEDAAPLDAKAWLGLIAQWVVGAVVGALLWVGFSYLWTHHPVIALIAAVLATAGLVLLVRAIRRSDDLQTTMLAVLVGLVVTISPAVLLLAAR